MYLIVGLGNPGENYEKTRHNAGYLFINKLAGKDKFEVNRKQEAEVLKKGELILAKPFTFMNDSGRAVRKIMDFYKLSIENVVVIHDDLDIAFGEYKIQKEVGPKVHNGIKSIEQYLGRKDFLRVRIGIDNRQPGVSYGTGADYVLSKMGKEELKELDGVIEEAAKELAEIFDLDIKL
ncbi:MAG: Peptidyl-tRNA hydrolase [candidate division WWE3 bacterium GW2011_GWB1_42_6]|uniref:Peptidyl-tRNA hydrolase n=1 Tax=candidate division WWE3 bacterium GW2011_GWB1_42_6 TaxID=1619115 RepID=A0A0G1AZQ8_UNCKA|nr:MAG: Peptidyl-tRNA hydrolase [candidate division WWE3 bacterium GW2011_GWB1_42_6]